MGILLMFLSLNVYRIGSFPIKLNLLSDPPPLPVAFSPCGSCSPPFAVFAQDLMPITDVCHDRAAVRGPRVTAFAPASGGERPKIPNGEPGNSVFKGWTKSGNNSRRERERDPTG